MQTDCELQSVFGSMKKESPAGAGLRGAKDVGLRRRGVRYGSLAMIFAKCRDPAVAVSPAKATLGSMTISKAIVGRMARISHRGDGPRGSPLAPILLLMGGAMPWRGGRHTTARLGMAIERAGAR